MKIKNIYRESNQLETNELIHQIIYLIKHKDDYEGAARIMIDRYISIEELSERTIKLTEIELAKLVDTLMANKNKIN